MLYPKEKLIEIAKPYFEGGVKVIYASEDGNMFYDNAKSYADAHSKRLDTRLYKLTKEDMAENKPKTPPSKEPTLRERAKSLGLTVPGRASDETIQKMIDSASEQNKE